MRDRIDLDDTRRLVAKPLGATVKSAQSMEKDQDFPVSIEVQLLGGNGADDRQADIRSRIASQRGKLCPTACNMESQRSRRLIPRTGDHHSVDPGALLSEA